MPASSITQKTTDLLIPYQTIHNKLRFWLSYLREALPQYTIVYLDNDGNAHDQLHHLKKGTRQVRILVQLKGQTLIRGIIHTSKAKEDAYKTVMVEQTLDDRVPAPSTFFRADRLLCFYRWDREDCGWESYRKPEKSFDPIMDVEKVRSYFAKALEVVPGMERREYAQWEREVGIDDEAMAKKDRDRFESFVAVGDWSRE